MATLKIEATEYTRQDGLKMLKLGTGKWVLRKIYGPAWFYSDSKDEWVISTKLNKLDEVGLTFDKATELLNTLPELQ